ncbi:MAG TPA: hypothetical protein VK024_07865 [Actinomycetaceae bacterium]|nr:hypothetical protein [Actinomycetaceae bacterium]
MTAMPIKRIVTTVPAHGAARERLGTLAALAGQHHPNVATVRAVNRQPDGRISILVGEPTGQRLESRMTTRPMARSEAAHLLHELGHGLGFLHERGLAHGDVSAASVLITPHGTPVLVDLVMPGDDHAGVAHRAPEWRAGAQPTAAGDVWALARLLTEACPHDDALADVLRPALAPRPERRPGARDLAAAAAQLGPRRALPPAEAGPRGAAEATERGHNPASRVHQRLAALARPRRRIVTSKRRLLGYAGVVVTAGGLTVATLALTAPGEGAAEPVSPEAAAPADMPGRTTEHTSPEGATAASSEDAHDILAALLGARDEAFATADIADVSAFAEPSTPAAHADATLLARIHDAGVQLRGMRTTVSRTAEVEELADGLRLNAWTAQSAHERDEGDGWRRVAAQEEVCLTYTLVPVGGEWRLAEVIPCA